MTTRKKLDEILENSVTAITDYGYNDEYGYYNDWADGVRPILEALLQQKHEDSYKLGYDAGKKKSLEVLERLKLEFDTVVCACGDEWRDSDAAKLVEDSLIDK